MWDGSNSRWTPGRSWEATAWQPAPSASAPPAPWAMGTRAYKLSAQALAASWPLPNGTLLAPRILSRAVSAPYLGESATLFALTRRAQFPSRGPVSTHLPAVVYAILAAMSAIGLYEIARGLARGHAVAPRRVPHRTFRRRSCNCRSGPLLLDFGGLDLGSAPLLDRPTAFPDGAGLTLASPAEACYCDRADCSRKEGRQ